MHDILKVNALYGSVKKNFHSSLSKDVSQLDTIDDFKLVTVSNTEYELEMITGTGLDDTINFF
jgi:hypothetical protein